MGTELASHQSTSSIQDTITCVQSSQYRYPTLLGSPAYTKVLLQGNTKVLLQGNTNITQVKILNVPAHGKGRHSMKTFSVVGPTMWNELLTNELRECTSVDVFKKRLKTRCCCCRPTPPACSCGGVRQPSFSREALPGVSST